MTPTHLSQGRRPGLPAATGPLLGLLVLLAWSNGLRGQCTDIYDVWNGVNVPNISSRVDSACAWDRTYSQFLTGDALQVYAYAGDTYTFSVCDGMGGADTEINIFRATTGFPNQAYDDDGCGTPGGESELTWTCATSGTYYVIVSLAGCVNTIQPMTLTVRRSSITGDVCQQATAVSSGSTAFSTAGACGYSMVSCATARNDRWYAYTPVDGGMTEFSTCGSAFDTHLSLWDACDGLELACNDDAAAGPCSGSTRSYFTYPVVAGQTYYVRVAGYNSATGSGTLTITPPPPGSDPGDDCTNPLAGSAIGQAYTGQSSVGHGNDVSSWSCGSGSYPGEDVYYTFSTSDGQADRLRITLSNVSDANDATVEVLLMTAGSCGAPTCQASATYDIASGAFANGMPYVDVPVTPLGSAGTYFVVVDSRVDGIDAFDLRIDGYRDDVALNGGCSVDDTDGDGIVTTWDGLSPAPANLFPGDVHTICHTLYLNASGGEGPRRLELLVSECLENLSSLGPAGGASSYYASVGGWRVDSVVGNRVYWRFDAGENRCGPGQVDVEIDVLTDAYGNETYWELVPAGTPCGGPGSIFQGGNTANLGCGTGGSSSSPAGGYASNTTISEGYWCLTQGADYDIKFIDGWGDGGAQFRVFMNRGLGASFDGRATPDSATFTFTADTIYEAPVAVGDAAGGAYTCNAYTFCYDARVDNYAGPCASGDSIQDFLRLFDERMPAAGSSDHFSTYLRTSGGDATILPIELLAFGAEREGRDALLQWTTASERGTERFVLERGDGQAWTDAGSVPAAGWSSQPRAYAWADRDLPYGTHYYRLRVEDRDGSVAWHGPVALTVPRPQAGPALAPNPTTGPLAVTGLPEGDLHWRVLDASGRPLREGRFAGNGVRTLDVSDLPSGLYGLRVVDHGTLRFVKR